MLQNLDITTILIIFVVLVISITIHEAMHAFTGYWREMILLSVKDGYLLTQYGI